MNGFGRYVSATSPDAFKAGLLSILNEIMNLGGARSGVGFTHPDLTVGAQYTYSVSFASGWNGDVVRKNIDSSGRESAIGNQNTAAGNLATLLTVTQSTPEPWKTERKIFTRVAGEHLPTNAVPFQFENLTAPQLSTLGATGLRQRNVIAYLRGDRSGEGDTLGKFRIRGQGPLGDIVDAKPVVVTASSCKEELGRTKCSYDEATNVGYKQFYGNHKTRSTMVYVAANDGMLHAFDGNLNEKWAYVPMDLFRTEDKAGIVNLTYQEGNLSKPFKHYNYVNATPRVTDVQIGGKWRTLLVGGLGKGGTSYYALDVTETNDVADEATGAPKKSLWEFTDDNMGYTFGRPILTKTKAWGGEWVAIMPSGYNNGKGDGQPKNGTGKGYLYFVSLETGKEKFRIRIDEGSEETPLGLAHIGGYVEHYSDQLTTAVYGGDQQGNFWRFNLEDSDPDKWTVTKMATLKDKDGNKQWVTTEPWPQLDGKGKRWVFVGTGGFRNNTDLLDPTTQHTFYAFRDGDNKKADVFVNRSPRSEGLTKVTDEAPSEMPDVEKGWYEDMDAGYHLNINPASAFGKVIYAANKYVGSAEGGTMTGELCNSATFIGRAYARDIRSAESALKVNDNRVHYAEIVNGIADVAITKAKIKDQDAIILSITGVNGSGLDQGATYQLDAKGGAGSTGVPVRTNIRYINREPGN